MTRTNTAPFSRMSLIPATLDPFDAAKAYADAWATLDFSRFVALLAPDARYASQYVLEELVGRDAIQSYLIGKVAAVRRSGFAVTAESPPMGVSATGCPQCGSPMIKRVAKRGANAGQSFYGCSRYPACHGTRSAV